MTTPTVEPSDVHVGTATSPTWTSGAVWEPAETDWFTVQFTCTGLGHWGGWLAHGDGTSQHVTNNKPTTHTYPDVGLYPATLTAQDGRRAITTVGIKDHAPVSWLYGNASTPYHQLVWVDEPNDGTIYRIAWGDGTPDTEVGDTRRPPHPRVGHLYRTPGQYTVTVTDLATRRTTTHLIVIPGLGVSFTFPTSANQPRLFTRCLTRWSTWHVDWGDGTTATGTVDATAELHVLHPDAMAPGRYSVTLTETPNTSVTPVAARTATRAITIPTDWDWGLDVWMTWRQTDDPSGEQTVAITPRDATHPCRVDWGDGSPASTVAPGATVRHTYSLPISPAGVPLYVREQPPDDSNDPVRVFHRVLAEPSLVSEPALSTRSRGAVDLVVGGLPNDDNADWYHLDWGDGTTHTYGAVGRWYTAVHTYTREDTYTITVDGPGMPAPITRTVTTRHYPSPSLSVREARVPERHDRRTVEAIVDNTLPDHCGGPVRIRWDIGVVETVPERSRTEHTYPADGTYTVIASCHADLTAKTRKDVTVPFGPSTTLDFDLLRHSPDDDYTVDVKITAYDPAKTIQVNWDDGTAPQVISPAGRTPHTYTSGSYAVEVSYTDGSEFRTKFVDIPLTETRR